MTMDGERKTSPDVVQLGPQMEGSSGVGARFHIKDEEDEAVTITTNDTNNDKVTLIEDDLNAVTDDTVNDIVEVTTKEDEKENVNSVCSKMMQVKELCKDIMQRWLL